MGWKLLKKRRWEGPFSAEELREMLKKGSINTTDFLLDENNDERFPSNYLTVGEVLKPETLEQIAEGEDGAQESEHQSNFDREEVTKLFDEEVEATDLVRKQKQEYGFEEAGVDEAPEEEAKGISARLRAMNWTRLAWGGSIVIFLAVSAVFLGRELRKKQQAPLNAITREAPEKKPGASESNPAVVRRPQKSQPRIRLPDRRPKRSPAQGYDDYEQDDYYYEDDRREDRPAPRPRTRDEYADDDYGDEREPDTLEGDEDYPEEYREDEYFDDDNRRDRYEEEDMLDETDEYVD